MPHYRSQLGVSTSNNLTRPYIAVLILTYARVRGKIEQEKDYGFNNLYYQLYNNTLIYTYKGISGQPVSRTDSLGIVLANNQGGN